MCYTRADGDHAAILTIIDPVALGSFIIALGSFILALGSFIVALGSIIVGISVVCHVHDNLLIYT
jgi:hypothetical protein